MLEEGILINTLQAGEAGASFEEAFKELVEEYQNLVYNTAMGFVRNAEDAEDIAQEVFAEVYRSVANFRGDSKLSTWLYRITTTKSLDFLRKMKRKKRWGSLIPSKQDPDEVKDVSYFHPGADMNNKEQSEALFKAIDKLPENQRIAFTLAKVDGLSYDEICDVMKTSKPSVESLVHRARTNLRKYLKKYYEREMSN
ncbi:MAG: sigma-70 family RNA polymerase sigma factor [Ignavibacteriae bacterium]|nr:sigma-70 family RNA polymerase sigma factor [Ignavibacteriota bacterium]MCB9244555.1 sigma-70 family RNA polymerase sigma factor [Ignavibacteriales bacterium]